MLFGKRRNTRLASITTDFRRKAARYKRMHIDVKLPKVYRKLEEKAQYKVYREELDWLPYIAEGMNEWT